MLEMNIDVIGNDLDELDRIVKELNDKAKGIKGINEVILRYKPPREELSLVLDDYNLLKAKLSNAEVGDFLKLAIQGGVATKFIYNEREIDVRVRFAEQYRNSERSLSEIRIKNRDNKFVPITDISTQKESLAPLKIYHKNKRRMLSFAMRMQNMSQSDIIKTIENLRTIKLPENYRLEFDKIFESKEKGGKNNLLQIGLILILFYMILASYSESFTYPIKKIMYLPASIAILFIIQKYVSGRLTLSAYTGLFLSLAIQIYFFVMLDRNNSRHSRLLILYSTLPNLGFFIAFLFFSFGSGTVIFDILFYYFLSVLLSLCLYPVYKSIFGNLESINRRNMR
jgi:multidrug efflux pump subunit AcrB